MNLCMIFNVCRAPGKDKKHFNINCLRQKFANSCSSKILKICCLWILIFKIVGYYIFQRKLGMMNWKEDFFFRLMVSSSIFSILSRQIFILFLHLEFQKYFLITKHKNNLLAKEKKIVTIKVVSHKWFLVLDKKKTGKKGGGTNVANISHNCIL